jgi:hypothetical protein
MLCPSTLDCFRIELWNASQFAFYWVISYAWFKLQSLVVLPGLLGVFVVYFLIDICFLISSFYIGFIWNWTSTFFFFLLDDLDLMTWLIYLTWLLRLAQVICFLFFFLYISFVLPYFFYKFCCNLTTMIVNGTHNKMTMMPY